MEATQFVEWFRTMVLGGLIGATIITVLAFCYNIAQVVFRTWTKELER